MGVHDPWSSAKSSLCTPQVFGVGVRVMLGDEGYVGLDRWHLINDVLDGGEKYKAATIVEKCLPRILNGVVYVPIFKYLSEIDALDQKGAIKKRVSVSPKITRLANKIRGGLSSSADNQRRAKEVLK